jgi:hypothetical protein
MWLLLKKEKYSHGLLFVYGTKLLFLIYQIQVIVVTYCFGPNIQKYKKYKKNIGRKLYIYIYIYSENMEQMARIASWLGQARTSSKYFDGECNVKAR